MVTRLFPTLAGLKRLLPWEGIAASRTLRMTADPLSLYLPLPAQAPDLVEPYANDKPDENITPVGRLYYAASTFICTPNSLSQEVGLGLGAQAGEARLRNVFTETGFTHFRRAAETPFNLILETRK
jgi:hypothetical protein